MDPLLCFKQLFNDAIINEIVQWTNVNLRAKNAAADIYKETNANEIWALLGLLVLSAVMRDNQLPVSELFDQAYSRPSYLSVMSAKRFATLVDFLRFDNKSEEALGSPDEFAKIRKVWSLFLSNCRLNYTPGSCLAIEEKLLPYRGKSSFKAFIPNSPSKYGLKTLILYDSVTKYMLNAVPYLGSNNLPTKALLAEYFVKELTQPVHGLNKTIIMDHKYTSVALTKDLLEEPYKLTVVGKLHNRHSEIPKAFRYTKTRPPYTSMFCYDHSLTLLSYKPNVKDVLHLLSSRSEEGVVNPATRKPLMLEFYNENKNFNGFDKFFNTITCSRKTRRWPMCIFYDMLNMALANSYIIYSHNVLDSGGRPLSGKEFAKKLHYDLIREHVNRRLGNPKLATNLKRNIKMYQSEIENASHATKFKTETEDENHFAASTSVLKFEIKDGSLTSSQNKSGNKRTSCRYCPYTKRRMTKTICFVCQKNMCAEHKIEVCTSCAQLSRN